MYFYNGIEIKNLIIDKNDLDVYRWRDFCDMLNCLLF